jgi:asparagine synthase (glutamine-hydrolysing)
MVADVPVGVLLSGGLDSSLLVALLAEEGQHGLSTFSIGFDGAGGDAGNEFEYSDLIAEAFGTRHQRLHVNTADLAPAIPGAVAAMSEPMASHDVTAFFLLSETVSRHLKVVQCGQGADEVFAGYGYHQPLASVGRPSALEAFTASMWTTAMKSSPRSWSPSGGPEPTPAVPYWPHTCLGPGRTLPWMPCCGSTLTC